MNQTTLDLTKALRDWQKDFLNDFKRFNVLVVHRRAWKTVVTILLLIIKALQTKGSYGYIAPTYRQAKKIAWKMLEKFGNQIGGFNFNISELVCTLPNGSTITLFGAENPDSLRWLDLQGVIFDEYAQQPNSIYSEIVFPMINANKGWVTWIGTPKGKNGFYQLYQRAIKDDRFCTMLLRASQTQLLNDEQLEDAKAEMTEEEYNQEYECSWDAFVKWAVYWKELAIAFTEERVRPDLYDPILPVTTFWDLGMADTMAIWFIQTVGKEIRIIDRYANNWFWFEHYTNIMIQKGYNYDKHYFPHDIANRELATGTSRLETVKQLLWPECYMVPKNTIESGISAWRLIFKYLYIDSGLDEFLNNLSLYQYEWDEKLGQPKKNPRHDFTSHDADWFRYMATIYRALTTPVVPKKVSRVSMSKFR